MNAILYLYTKPMRFVLTKEFNRNKNLIYFSIQLVLIAVTGDVVNSLKLSKQTLSMMKSVTFIYIPDYQASQIGLKVQQLCSTNKNLGN